MTAHAPATRPPQHTPGAPGLRRWTLRTGARLAALHAGHLRAGYRAADHGRPDLAALHRATAREAADLRAVLLHSTAP